MPETNRMTMLCFNRIKQLADPLMWSGTKCRVFLKCLCEIKTLVLGKQSNSAGAYFWDAKRRPGSSALPQLQTPELKYEEMSPLWYNSYAEKVCAKEQWYGRQLLWYYLMAWGQSCQHLSSQCHQCQRLTLVAEPSAIRRGCVFVRLWSSKRKVFIWSIFISLSTVKR